LAGLSLGGKHAARFPLCFFHLPSDLGAVKTEHLFWGVLTSFRRKNKTGAESILVIFQDRPAQPYQWEVFREIFQ